MSSTTQFSPELRGQYKAKAYAAANVKSPLVPFTIPRRDPGEHDVQIEILFCGICHSDLHQVRNEWSTGPLSIHAFRDMRSLAVSPRSAPQSPSSRPATLLQSAAWLTPTATVPSAGRSRAVLPTYDSHLQFCRRAPWRRHLWWLFRQYCG